MGGLPLRSRLASAKANPALDPVASKILRPLFKKTTEMCKQMDTNGASHIITLHHTFTSIHSWHLTYSSTAASSQPVE